LNLTNQHKALLITLLIAGSVVLSVFNLSLKQQNELASESYYEIEPEKELTEEELKILEALDKLSNSKAETNNAFNESEKSNHFAQAFKPIAPPEDYVPKEINHSDNADKPIKNYDSTDDSKLNQEELSKFSKVNDLIKKQQSDSNNSKSSISFSLVNRKKVHIPIPIYLCEVDGKIVVNINVDANGNVTDAYLNTSSKSDNVCLIEHALQYAKQSQFSADVSKENQIGSITFFFIGKR
jgi:outer membrane biosynthesis protein TonB